jgi:hypothetical protein
MALIWADCASGQKLARLWQSKQEAAEALALAEAGADLAVLGQAMKTHKAALVAYEQACEQARAELKQTGLSYTHALVIGVGTYDDAKNIPAVETSVHGARRFARWLLEDFTNPDCRLGSLDLIISGGPGLESWQPQGKAAAALDNSGAALDLQTEEASFANIKAAFTRWLDLAAERESNSAWFYFAGHGLSSGATSIVLPKDAKIPTSKQGADALIDLSQTRANMFNTKPKLQYFFVDACKEIIDTVQLNEAEVIGTALYSPPTKQALSDLDAWAFNGALRGKKAFGPDNDAPYFTQELIECLNGRAAARKVQDSWLVTSTSLRDALNMAWKYRSEKEGQGSIKFSSKFEEGSETGVLCQIPDPTEIFVKVSCADPALLEKGTLFADTNPPAAELQRPKPLPQPWHTVVPRGACITGARFANGAALKADPEEFVAVPPMVEIVLDIQPVGGE